MIGVTFEIVQICGMRTNDYTTTTELANNDETKISSLEYKLRIVHVATQIQGRVPHSSNSLTYIQ